MYVCMYVCETIYTHMQPLKYSLKPGSSLDLPGSSSLEFLYKDGWGLEGVKCSVRSAIKKLPR